MTDYTITTDFGAKDSLPSGNAGKVIKGSEFTTEFTNIKTAVNSKADSAGDTFTGAVTFDAAVTFNADVTFDTNTLFVDVSANKVGIGNTSPASTLDVNGTVTIGGDGSSINFTGTSGSNFITAKQGLKVDIDSDVNQGGTLFSVTSNNGANNVFNVKEDGDASFYDTAGTNVKLFWDASAESLGIGTTSPDVDLHINNTAGSELRIDTTGGSNVDSVLNFRENGVDRASLYWDGADNDLYLETTFGDIALLPTGNVGIGTANPDSALEVQGSVNGVHQIHIQNLFDDNDDDEPNPSARLYLSSASNNAFIKCEGAPEDTAGLHKIDIGSTAANSFLTFSPNNAERMRIDSAGRVGIGNTNPTSKFVVQDTNGCVSKIVATDGGSSPSKTAQLVMQGYEGRGAGIFIQDSKLSASSPNDRTWFMGTGYSTDSFGIGYAADGVQSEYLAQNKLKIDTSGRVDITAANYAFNSTNYHIRLVEDSGSAYLSNIQGGLYLQAGGRYYGSSVYQLTDGATSMSAIAVEKTGQISFVNATGATANGTVTPDLRMRITSSGNVLVGTTSYQGSGGSGAKGTFIGEDGLFSATRSGETVAVFNRTTSDGGAVELRKNGTTVGSISVTSSATSYNTSSDERLKENITDSADAGSKVDAIQIRQFDWKADGSHQDYGVIAQELVEVAPEAVSEGETEEDMMGVDYSKLVPMLIKEVQSLRSRVAELENV